MVHESNLASWGVDGSLLRCSLAGLPSKMSNLSIGDLIGKLPYPLPQTRANIVNFIRKHEKELKPQKIKGKTDNGNRWIINKSRLDKLLTKLTK